MKIDILCNPTVFTSFSYRIFLRSLQVFCFSVLSTGNFEAFVRESTGVPCVNLCCVLVDFKTESFLTNQNMIYGLVLLCMYMYCCMGEKCPFRGQNLGSVLWVSPLRIHLKLHKSGVPGL